VDGRLQTNWLMHFWRSLSSLGSLGSLGSNFLANYRLRLSFSSFGAHCTVVAVSNADILFELRAVGFALVPAASICLQQVHEP
jgi:hypothetical protein